LEISSTRPSWRPSFSLPSRVAPSL
jgi:hypothetical protein